MRLENELRQSGVRYEALLELSEAMGSLHGLQQPVLEALASGEMENPAPFGEAITPTGAFIASMHEEVLRVSAIVAFSAERLWSDLSLLVQRLPVAEKGSVLDADFINEAWVRCDELGRELTALDAFVRVSGARVAHLAEAVDTGADLGLPPTAETAGEDCGPMQDAQYTACFRDCIMAGLRLEPILVGLSDACEHLRKLQEGRSLSDTGDTAWEPPSRFTRDTTKFWLRPRDAMRFRVELVKHLPLLIFAKREKLVPGSGLRAWSNLRGQSTVDGCLVQSVYFDDREMHSYAARLRRDDRASVVRVRWYGDRSPAADQELFVESKLHREPWTGERSCKERCPVHQQDLLPLMTGANLPPDIKPGSADEQFLSDIQGQVSTGQQEPMLRTVCSRVAFQETSSDLVRVSLDMDLHMINELDAPRAPGDWCRDERMAVSADDVVHFPYCVVEMKLRLEQPPDWMQAMVSSGLLLHAPRFSKYHHGAASLFPSTVEKMPYWFLHNTDGTMSPATWEEMADESDNFYDQNAAPWLFPKKGDVPVMARLSGFLHRKLGIGGILVDGKGPQEAQEVAQLRATRAEQARETRFNAVTSSADPVSPMNGKRSQSTASQMLDFDLVSVPGPRENGIAQHAVGQQPQKPQHQSQEQLLGQVDVEAPSAIVGPQLLQLQSQKECRRNRWLAAPLAVFKGRAPAARVNDTAAEMNVLKTGASSNSSNDGSSGKKPKLVQPGSYRSKALVRSRVEPKTFFANERTFLSWLHISVLIMLTGLTLLGGSFQGSSASSSCVSQPQPAKPGEPQQETSIFNSLNCKAGKYAGMVISPVAALFMIYALYMYKKRTIQIMQQRKSVRFDDQRGPVILVVLLVGALLTSVVITVRAAFSAHA